jgi:hypothetical protein
MRQLLVLFGAIFILAEAPAAPAAPVRHLEYAFAVYPTAQNYRGYYDGTLNVDILGPAADGGVSVRMNESWYRALRARQPRLCEVYADGTVRCDDVPPFPTETQLALFPLLGKDFFNGASSQGTSTWQQKFQLKFAKGLYSAAALLDSRATEENDGRILTGTMTGTYKELDSGRPKTFVDVSFVYDRTAHVPFVVHDARFTSPGSIYNRTSVDLQLTDDSASSSDEAAALQRLGPVRFEASGYADEGD